MLPRMTGSILFRPAGTGDAPAIAAIAHTAFAPYVARIGRRPAPMDADHRADIARGRVVLAQRGTLVVGFATWRESADAVDLETVAVAPAAQGDGIGTALIGRCEAAAGARPVRLYTNAAMAGALRLYPRLGYAETGRARVDGFDRVFFRKPPPARR